MTRSLMVIVAGYVAIAASISVFGWTDTWQTLGVRAITPHHTDLRLVLEAPSAMALGLDPLVNNPTHPLQLPMNYPRLWAHGAARLHLSSQYVTPIGAAMAVLFLVAALRLLSAVPAHGRPFFVLCMFSAATLLALERGNTDLIMFSLLVFGLFALDRNHTGSVAMLSAVGMLKIFPAVGLPLLLGSDRKKNTLILASLAVAGAYWVFAFGDLALIARATPQNLEMSYGALSLHKLPPVLPAYQADLWKDTTASRAAFVIAFAVVALSAGLAGALGKRSATIASGSLRELLFVAGASVYIFSFVVGSNWDYRLIFLLPCIPLLGEARLAPLMVMMLVAMNSDWLDLLGPAGLWIGVATDIGLLCALAYWLGTIARDRIWAGWLSPR